MARSSILAASTDLQSDTGSVLWSFVQGEQLEFPVTLDFLTDTLGYTFEAVVVEALNVSGQSSAPESINPTGVHTTLTVRVPTSRGAWSAGNAYNREDYISYLGTFYKLSSGSARINATTPNLDSTWVAYVPNKVYIQFPSTLSMTPAWAVQPNLVFQVYGFFELRVTEPTGGIYQKTWKPMRGVVELQFSPTQLVP
jgi:hypothetical protein